MAPPRAMRTGGARDLTTPKLQEAPRTVNAYMFSVAAIINGTNVVHAKGNVEPPLKINVALLS